MDSILRTIFFDTSINNKKDVSRIGNHILTKRGFKISLTNNNFLNDCQNLVGENLDTIIGYFENIEIEESF